MREFVLPAWFLFAVPLFSYCFFLHAERTYYAVHLELCSDCLQFKWLRRAALASLILGASSALIGVTCAALANVSRRAQYLGFLVGFRVLCVMSSAQVVAQGLLLVGLSYWMSALWLDIYVPKLIAIVAGLALLATYTVLKASLSGVAEPLALSGELLREQDAPELWAQIKNTCLKLGTEPPQNIVAGIDDNFFVTEGRVALGAETLDGRTLFVSLSLLKNLEAAEASAVLAHEMAHFSAGDTVVSSQLSPLLTQYGVYLKALAEGGLSLPVFYFMRLFRALFELSLGRASRRREQQADQLAAAVTSPEHAARALIKVGAYASYRARVERDLFEQNRAHPRLEIASLVAQGFSSYTQTHELLTDLHETQPAHPFDSHPPLAARLEALGVRLSAADYAASLSRPVGQSWFGSMAVAQAIEERLWQAYEDRFAEVHQLALAYRFEPASDEERVHVARYFPRLTFDLHDGGSVELTYSGLSVPDWATSLEFRAVAACAVNQRMFKKYLDLKIIGEHGLEKRSLCLAQLVGGSDTFLEAFQRYYGRHLYMLDQRAASGGHGRGHLGG